MSKVSWERGRYGKGAKKDISIAKQRYALTSGKLKEMFGPVGGVKNATLPQIELILKNATLSSPARKMVLQRKKDLEKEFKSDIETAKSALGKIGVEKKAIGLDNLLLSELKGFRKKQLQAGNVAVVRQIDAEMKSRERVTKGEPKRNIVHAIKKDLMGKKLGAKQNLWDRMLEVIVMNKINKGETKWATASEKEIISMAEETLEREILQKMKRGIKDETQISEGLMQDMMQREKENEQIIKDFEEFVKKEIKPERYYQKKYTQKKEADRSSELEKLKKEESEKKDKRDRKFLEEILKGM